ncbi:MAG: rhodanese-like domain-containing protein [Chloroflexi bacterium]|nr:rhodanese-like domain-containing protein [Chloroflexota bacterium]
MLTSLLWQHWTSGTNWIARTYTAVPTRLSTIGALLLVGWSIALLASATTVGPVLAQTGTIFQATLLESNQKTPEISTEELRTALRNGTATVFDARPHLEYATSHIPGAVNVAPKPGVPMSVYVSDVAEIARIVSDKDAPIVLYCNGPFCGKSKRLGEELMDSGYTNVRRYQLGAPTWRALVGVMQIEVDGIRYVRDDDRTAVFVDARPAPEVQAGSLPGARSIPLGEVVAAKDDGRLPMEDHNTRIIVFGADPEQARAVTAELAKNAFHNVAYFAGSIDDLVAGLAEPAVAIGR